MCPDAIFQPFFLPSFQPFSTPKHSKTVPKTPDIQPKYSQFSSFCSRFLPFLHPIFDVLHLLFRYFAPVFRCFATVFSIFCTRNSIKCHLVFDENIPIFDFKHSEETTQTLGRNHPNTRKKPPKHSDETGQTLRCVRSRIRVFLAIPPYVSLLEIINNFL